MASNEIKIEEIVIAAWLHDVGKFAQRADVDELYDKKLEKQYCKTTKDGRYTHQHVIYTEGFLSKYRDILPDSVNWENVKNLAANHHNPSSYYDWIIAEADRLSSGSDRCNVLGLTDSEKENEFDEEKEKLKFYEKPMLHILSTLKLDDKPDPKKAYCKMAVLENDNVLSDKEYKTSKEEYKRLWDDFVKDFKKLQNLSFDNFLLSLNSLLERYIYHILSLIDVDINLYSNNQNKLIFYNKVSINIERDKSEIYSYLSNLENSIAKEFPNLLEEWDYERNGNLKPEMFSAGSNEKVWWKCKDCGNSWQAVIRERVKGCKKCLKCKNSQDK